MSNEFHSREDWEGMCLNATEKPNYLTDWYFCILISLDTHHSKRWPMTVTMYHSFSFIKLVFWQFRRYLQFILVTLPSQLPLLSPSDAFSFLSPYLSPPASLPVPFSLLSPYLLLSKMHISWFHRMTNLLWPLDWANLLMPGVHQGYKSDGNVWVFLWF